jgi:hypothetical protein
VTKTFVILLMRPSWPIHPTVLYSINLIIIDVQSMKLLLCNFPHSAFTAFTSFTECYSSRPPRDHAVQPYRTWARCTRQHKRTVRFQKLIRNVFLILHGHNINCQQRELSEFLIHYQQLVSLLTAGPRDQFPRWRRSIRRLSVCSFLRCPDSLWKLDASVKAGVLVDLVCLMTTLKECVRHFSEVAASQWLEQGGIGHAKNGDV